MDDDRVDDLLLVTVESDDASKFYLNETLNIIENMKNHL